jgi:cellulose synthase/poly-beta-1,6-N-acetylglucosamine synthase-like glycosyltransferase
LRNLLNQQYPDFGLHVLIDSETDPAWISLREIQQEFGPDCMNISVLQHRIPCCSLKNSSIIQAVKSLPSDIELVAFVDADAITYPTWLRDLVAPLADPEIGCTTGIRWFAPPDHEIGSIVRFHWNTLASSVIYASGIPWGGSMVIRRSILDTGLTDEWSRMFCEDAYTRTHLKHKGFRLTCVPEATIVNRESTTLKDCINFINRQTLILRLYNRHWWWLVAAMVIFMSVLKITYVATTLYLLAHSEWTTAVMLMVCGAMTYIAREIGIRGLSNAVEKKMKQCGRSIPRAPRLTPPIFFTSQTVFINSMMYSLTTRQVTWRGIHYRVHGPKSVRMIDYVPSYDPTNAVAGSEAAFDGGV